MKINLFVISTSITATLLLSGCSSSNTQVLGNATIQKGVVQKYDSFVIEESIIANNVPQEKRTYFQNKLGTMFKDGGFKDGNGIKVTYSFMAYNEGSQFSRYMLGGLGGGKGKLMVKTSFYDVKTGALLNEIQSEGEVSGGFFGGSFDGTLNAVAEEIYNFAKSNYMIN